MSLRGQDEGTGQKGEQYAEGSLLLKKSQFLVQFSGLRRFSNSNTLTEEVAWSLAVRTLPYHDKYPQHLSIPQASSKGATVIPLGNCMLGKGKKQTLGGSWTQGLR